ncbi:MAG: biotin--[acetyl-CoA-carboxylase] ligase [Planctomycetota bacterium]|nr:biotin--[acetyl-CoA-carboxylase] ligase [Planctomycetota bacterium]
MASSSFNLTRLRNELRPFRLYWFPRLRSTNDHAAALRKHARLFAPAVVLTAHQTAGRGRGSNAWFSTPGCLTVTFAFPIEEHLSVHQLPLVAGLATRNAAAELCGEPAIGLKWPNDIVHNGRKLAGLLCERIHRVDLIGLGLNVNNDPRLAPSALRSRVTCLSAIAGRQLDMTEVLATIARHMHRTLSRRNQHPFASLLQEYNQHHVLPGRRVRLCSASHKPRITGLCTGLDHLGRLLVQDQHHTHPIVSGHIELIT